MNCWTITYFLECAQFIKIGRTTTTSAYARIKNLQVGSPLIQTPLGFIDAKLKSEKEMHEQFKHIRIQGEWFVATPDLRKFIQDYAEPWDDKKFLSCSVPLRPSVDIDIEDLLEGIS